MTNESVEEQSNLTDVTGWSSPTELIAWVKSTKNTEVSEVEFRKVLLQRLTETAQAGDDATDPQSPHGRLFERYGATKWELAFASDTRIGSYRVLRALEAYEESSSPPARQN